MVENKKGLMTEVIIKKMSFSQTHIFKNTG